MEEKIKEWLSERLPFVVYRKPYEQIIKGWFQHTDHLYLTDYLDRSCFVLAPFSGTAKVVFYPENCSYLEIPVNIAETYNVHVELKVDEQEKVRHMHLVQRGIDAISDGKMTKVVLSRKEEVALDPSVFTGYFNRFLHKYPTAFVYGYYHPEIGMWMGATPEQLLKIEGHTVKTVALAGTMTDSGKDPDEISWGNKEQEEQQVVTDFIVEKLRPFTSDIRQTKPFTHKAGSLLHIKTDIEAVLNDPQRAYEVVASLHPTPALCGFPKETARNFIIAEEGYDREYYGGYIGEWRSERGEAAFNSDLFVNLRCMKMEGDRGYLYLGGGVNKDSDPEKEYYETVNKSKTVKSIL